MKHISLSPLLLLIFILPSAGLAQQSSFDFTLRAGLNLSYLSFDNEEVPGKRIKPGVNIGLAANYHTSESLFLQTALTFTTKGARIRGNVPLGFEGIVVEGRTTKPELTSQQMYVQVPLHIGYKIPLTPKKKLTVQAGPYAAYGVAGKTRLAANVLYGDYIDDTPMEEKTFGERGLQKLDYGAGAGIGLDLGETIISLNYELGLRNIAPTGITYIPFYHDTSYKNRNLCLQVDFRF